MFKRFVRILSTPGEQLTATGALLTLLAVFFSAFAQTSEKWTRAFESVGLLVLLAGVVTAIGEIKERLLEIKQAVAAAQAVIGYGAAVSVIAEALSNAYIDPTKSHVLAGGRALQHYALKVLRERAVDLKSFEGGQGQVLRLVEYNYINDFLRHLATILSEASMKRFPAIWLGITRLTAGWLKDQAEPGYREFAAAVQKYSHNGRLSVVRIYVYSDDGELEQLKAHLTAEARAGILVKTLRLRNSESADPPDMTLIFPPNSMRRDQIKTGAEPVRLFADRRISAVCAMEFSTSAGRQIRELRVYPPAATEATSLSQQFEKAWTEAVDYTSSPGY